jgi:NADH-quinone oxidoreductase subunit L
MVIAGVFLGMITADMLILFTDYFSLGFLFFYLVPLNTTLWSLLKAVSVSDIKLIIAPSTISQVSYMFIGLYINPVLCFYHITIHSLFKSILFLLAGSLIHTQYHYQSTYQIKTKHRFYCITYTLTSSTLVLSLSKETIIHDTFQLINSAIAFILLNLGAVFTIHYTLRILWW